MKGLERECAAGRKAKLGLGLILIYVRGEVKRGQFVRLRSLAEQIEGGKAESFVR